MATAQAPPKSTYALTLPTWMKALAYVGPVVIWGSSILVGLYVMIFKGAWIPGLVVILPSAVFLWAMTRGAWHAGYVELGPDGLLIEPLAMGIASVKVAYGQIASCKMSEGCSWWNSYPYPTSSEHVDVGLRRRTFIYSHVGGKVGNVFWTDTLHLDVEQPDIFLSEVKARTETAVTPPAPVRR